MRDDRDVDAAYFPGAPGNAREREHSARTDEHATARTEGPVRAPADGAAASPTGGPADDISASSTAGPAEIADARLRYGIVEEADDDLGEGLYERRAA